MCINEIIHLGQCATATSNGVVLAKWSDINYTKHLVFTTRSTCNKYKAYVQLTEVYFTAIATSYVIMRFNYTQIVPIKCENICCGCKIQHHFLH